MAGNVNDQDLVTVWTHEILPAWIKIDMLELRTVGYVKIAFTRGDQRTVGFNIELSEDNTAWNTAFTGNSSGITAGLQEFEFTDTNARFVRINVTSNSQKNTASIKEIEVWGRRTLIGQEPPPGPAPERGITEEYGLNQGDRGLGWYMYRLEANRHQDRLHQDQILVSYMLIENTVIMLTLILARNVLQEHHRLHPPPPDSDPSTSLSASAR